MKDSVRNCANISENNAAVEAMKELQKSLDGAAEKAGLTSEEKIVALIKEIRAELSEEQTHID